MNICVVGCGAIGGIYAAHLAQHPDVNVWAYDNNSAHVDAINQHGLQLRGLRQMTARITATTDSSAVPSCALTIIATKSKHTEVAMKSVAHVTREGIVCSLQNGIANEARIAPFTAGVISGTVLIGGHVCAPGTIEFDADGTTSIGRALGTVDQTQILQLAALLSAQGLATQVLDDPRPSKWTKLIFNAAANPLCAITRLPFGKVYQDVGLRTLMYRLVDEGIAVAQAHGIELDAQPRDLLDEAAITSAEHQPSMLSDVLNQVVTEIDSINGDIVRYGQQTDTPCPLNEALIALVKGLERSW